MVNTSSAQGAQFAEACEEMTRTVQALGPSPLGKKPATVATAPPAETAQPEAQGTS